MRNLLILATGAGLVVTGAVAGEVLMRGKLAGHMVSKNGQLTPAAATERLGDPIWSATRFGRFYYPASENRERVDEGILGAGTEINGFAYVYCTDHQRCFQPAQQDPNDPNCTENLQVFYDDYNAIECAISGPTGVGGGSPTATFAGGFIIDGLPGGDPNLPAGYGSCWIITLDLEGGNEFTMADGNFGWGFWYPDPPTLVAGNFGAGPVAGRATVSSGSASTFDTGGFSGSSAPGALDQYDRYTPPGKWTSIDGDPNTPASNYLGIYDLNLGTNGACNTYDPNFTDPNNAAYGDWSNWWLELYAAAGPCGGNPLCFTDVDGDCIIGSAELQCVLDNWSGPTPSSGPCGAMSTWNGDATVGSNHLQNILDTWANNCN